MGQQSRLEKISIDKREELELKLDYTKGMGEYSEGHKDAISDGDVKGKGSPFVGEPYIQYSDEKNNAYRSTFDIENGGGLYDIKGAEGADMAFKGRAGRDYLMGVNKYRPGLEYGENSVDTSVNVNIHGQIKVE
jgi:hypothetical protein